MKKENIIVWVSTVAALAVAILFFFNWYPETFLRGKQEAVTMADIEADLAEDYCGLPAGEDIPRLAGAEEFLDTLNYSDYFTLEPVDIVPTGVYSLKSWVNPYRTRRGKHTGKRKPEVIQSKLDLQEDHNQYYLLGMQDGTYILAQIPGADAAAIKRGKSVLLPIGQRVGMTETARGHLSDVCEEYGASMDGVFYAFDDEWYKENYYLLFFLRYGVAAALCLTLAVVLITLGNKVFRVKGKD